MDWDSFASIGRAATSMTALCVCTALECGSLFADGVTRSVEPVPGGCKVTLAWEFTGKVESDLVIEERLAQGWSVDSATVPFASLDASWFSGGVARFAVKPALLTEAGVISFTLMSDTGIACGTVSGDWKMYLNGALRKGGIAGQNTLNAIPMKTVASGTVGATGTTGTAETPVAITSFEIVGGAVELSYSGVGKVGTLVVEGCAGLGKPWMEVKRNAVSAGHGKVILQLSEADGCNFFRIKLLTEAQ